MTDLDGDFLAITLSDSEPDPGAETATCTPAEGTSAATKVDRTALSEEAFQALKASYRAKIENGEIWSTISSLPLTAYATKPEAQELLHAVEELYFFRRYDEALGFLSRIFSEAEGGGEKHLDDDVKKLLRHYERRCLARLGQSLSPTQNQTQASSMPAEASSYVEVANTPIEVARTS